MSRSLLRKSPIPYSRNACAVLLLLCLTGLANLSVARQLKLKSYTVDDGLSQNTVWDYLIDCRGFLWMGTADGIDRFDGERILHYGSDPTRSSFLQTDVVYRFAEDEQRDIWVSSTKGLGFYDRIKDSFRTIALTRHWCTLLGADNKGCIWFADGIDSLYAWHKKEQRIVTRTSLTKERSWNTASTMNCISLGDHVVAVLDLKHLLVLNKNTGHFTLCKPVKHQSSCLGKLDDSTILTEHKGFFYRYRLREDSLVCVAAIRSNLSDSNLFTCFERFQDKLYAGGPMGLFELDPESYKVKDSLLSAYDHSQGDFTYVQSIRADPEGSLFLCTNGAGLKIYNPGNNKFRHYRMEAARNNMVKSIYALGDGTVYAGLWGRGVVAYDTAGHGRLMTFGLSRKVNSVVAIAQWSQALLLLVQSNELTWYNHKKKQVERVRKISDTQFFATPQFREGNLLNVVCRSGSQLLSVSADGSFKEVLYIPGTQLRTFLRYKEGNYLLGTTIGLIYAHGPGARQDTLLHGIVIKDLYRRADSSIWIATTNGLYHYDSDLRLRTHFGTHSGLPNNFVYGILEDRFGRLWFSHNKGISCLEPGSGRMVHYSIKDGLQSNEFNSGAFFKDDKGLLYFGGINGVNVIDPGKQMLDTTELRLAMNQIYVNDLPIVSDTAINELRELRLSYEENTISFNFAGLEYCRPEACRYRYQLEGFDREPIESGSTHFARYANLPPGKYRFLIWIANADGVWSTRPRSVVIFIRAPFWQTTLFRVFLFLLVVVLLSLPVYWYVRSQRRKALRQAEWRERLDAERMRISRDLHDNVGAQLSYLINNIDWMQEHPEQLQAPAAIERLRTLSDAGRNAMQTLRQTIWAFSRAAVSVEDFADRFKQFALRMLELNPSVQLSVSEQLDAHKTLSPTLALNLFRIGQEAFNNSLKHSACTTLSVRFLSDERYLLLLEIADDGKGFDPQNTGKADSYGLQNMEARARESNLNLDIHSVSGQGTRITIYLEQSKMEHTDHERN